MFIRRFLIVTAARHDQEEEYSEEADNTEDKAWRFTAK